MPEPIAESLQLHEGALCLRAYRGDDAAALHAAVHESIDSVGRWLPWCHANYGKADADAWIAHCAEGWRSGEHYAFALFDADSGDFCGAVGLNQRNREHNFMNLGYWVRTSQQGNGVAVRAAQLVSGFGFEQIGLTRIEIVTALDNRASRRVAEKSGAAFEAIARNRLVDRGNPIDAALYALMPATR